MNSIKCYGEDILYSIEKVRPEDLESLQVFSCDNEVLDKYIREDVVKQGADGNKTVYCEDGLHFKVVKKDTKEIIGFVSLASSGIVFREGNYTHILPAIKIDVFAIDLRYQKMQYCKGDKNDHYYFSDDVMARVICHIRQIDSEYALVKYIILYADIKAEHFYRRNFFRDFSEFMEQEHNQEIIQNIPMIMEL